jgi:uncharacterized damage-inducible protein DinB
MHQKKNYRPGAKGALLDEYERAISDLNRVISDVTDQELISIADHQTKDPECVSIQSVLSHVVSSGYSYAVYIQKIKEQEVERPTKNFRTRSVDYINDLENMFAYNVNVFNNIQDDELEQYDNELKVLTRWGQRYDIEQITEHAIVHILRHRRQIEKFKLTIRNAH